MAALLLVVSAATVFSAIGLLRRKNWARLTFIAIMVLGIIWNIGGFCLQISVFSSVGSVPAHADEAKFFQALAAVVMIFSLVLALGFSALFGWIIQRLTSSPIRREFGMI